MRTKTLDLPGPMRLVVTDEIAGAHLSRALVLVLQPNGEDFDPLSSQWFPSIESAWKEMTTFVNMWMSDLPEAEVQAWVDEVTK